MWIRHLLSIALLPFVVAVLVPYWIAQRQDRTPVVAGSGTEILLQFVGIVVFATGLAFFVSTLLQFVRDGKGTLAPWDPPRRLVVSGLYRYVRNPMITGVALTLVGEALVLLSSAHLVWAAAFTCVNLVMIPLFEEPRLRTRFGADYEEYCRHVPRLFPRLRPWSDGAQ